MSQRKDILSLLSRVDPDIAENVRLEPVPGGFVNLTGLSVSDQVMALLSYGPRFLLPEDATIPGVFSQFGEMHVQIERHIGLGITGPIFIELLDKYKSEKDKLFSQRQPSLLEVAIRRAVIEAKDFFRQYMQACVVQSDKGNRTCLMLLPEYEAKMNAYVEKCIDKGVYRLTNARRVDATRNIFLSLRKAILAVPLNQTDTKMKKLLANLRTFGHARLPYLYGNVKCHKPDTPIRPICSTVAWYSRPIQQLLYYILSEYLRDALCSQNVKRISDVAKRVAEIPAQPGFVFVKLDVTDMYGSMDKRRISLLLDRLLERIEEEGRSILPRALVGRMIRFSLGQSCLITYQDNIYVQLMGLPQGACDSGFLATVYLDYILQLHHEELFVAHHVTYWAKYMDDFLLYMPAKNVSFFKQRMEFLTGLKFETEPEEEVTEGVFFDQGVIRSIPFLDIYIHTVKDGPYLVSNYRKPTASQRIIHALSNTIHSYKVNTIHGFLNNLFQRTSTVFLIYDLNQLYSRILMNGYSQNFIECIYYKAIIDEEQRLHQEVRRLQGGRSQGSCRLSPQKRDAQIGDAMHRILLLQDYRSQFSFDHVHHYQVNSISEVDYGEDQEPVEDPGLVGCSSDDMSIDLEPGQVFDITDLSESFHYPSLRRITPCVSPSVSFVLPHGSPTASVIELSATFDSPPPSPNERARPFTIRPFFIRLARLLPSHHRNAPKRFKVDASP